VPIVSLIHPRGSLINRFIATASYGLFEDGTPGELFLNTSKGSN
jgi:hypothetical protein